MTVFGITAEPFFAGISAGVDMVWSGIYFPTCVPIAYFLYVR